MLQRKHNSKMGRGRKSYLGIFHKPLNYKNSGYPPGTVRKCYIIKYNILKSSKHDLALNSGCQDLR